MYVKMVPSVKKICIFCIFVSFLHGFFLAKLHFHFFLLVSVLTEQTDTGEWARFYSISGTVNGIVNHFMTLRFLILVMLEQEGGQMSVNVQSLQEIKSAVNWVSFVWLGSKESRVELSLWWHWPFCFMVISQE